MHLIRIHPRDQVAVVPGGLDDGQVAVLGDQGVRARGAVPPGHKVAVAEVARGDTVLKYGMPIGRASAAIRIGDWVHEHNLASALDSVTAPTARSVPMTVSEPPTVPRFDGYRRRDGRVGTRNELWIVPTVGCVARLAERVARTASRRAEGRADGVLAMPHPFGCSQLGDDLAQTRQLLAGLIRHPNAGGVLVIGLGCENNQLRALLESAAPYDEQRLIGFDAQSVADEDEAALSAVERLLDRMARDRRQPCPASELVVGLKCGGSDALSGLTANPLVGRVADRVVDWGGGALLSEIPEMFGAEHLLAARAINDEVRNAFLGLIEEFKRYYRGHGQPIDENPSPGNKEGGLTTLAEKSLGAVQKGGSAPVSRVLPYAAPAPTDGLSVVAAPGNDGISSTAMVAAGATLLLFTTGRGTPMGFPVPTVKIASNRALARRKPHWIDFDAGPIAEGADVQPMAEALLDQLLEIASGRMQTRNEENDEREIAVWKRGVTL